MAVVAVCKGSAGGGTDEKQNSKSSTRNIPKSLDKRKMRKNTRRENLKTFQVKITPIRNNGNKYTFRFYAALDRQ